MKTSLEKNEFKIYETTDYKRSRKAYTIQCAFEHFVGLTITDAFLAKLLSTIGVGDAAIGIISSIVSFAFLFQLLSLFLVKKIKNIKKSAVIFSCTSQFLFMLVYTVPFLPVSVSIKTLIVSMFILCGYFMNYVITNVIYNWGNSYVEPEKRGVFSANKEMISLVTGMVVTFVLGYIMDKYEAMDNIYGSFVFIAIASLIFCTCNFICLMNIKNKEMDKKTSETPLGTVIKSLRKNKNYTNVVILNTIFTVGTAFTSSFMGIYKTKDLIISVGTVQLINNISYLARAVISKPFGRYSDKHTFIKGIELGLIIGTIAFALIIFTNPATRWLVVAYTILLQVSTAGTYQNFFNVMYSYVPKEYFIQATAVKNSIGGLFVFLSSLLAGKLVSVIQANGNMLFGIHIYAQQVLACVSVILFIISILFAHFVVAKQNIMKQ